MSSLEELRKRLYKKEALLRRRHTLAPASSEESEHASGYWRHTEHMSAQKRKKRVPLYVWLIGLLAVVALGLLSAAILYVSGYFDAGTVSGRNISFSVESPREINGGDRVDWLVSITNGNSVPLDTADLIVQYPDGAQAIAQSNAVRERRALGRLAPGETRNELFGAYVFGAEGDERIFHATLEYRPEGTSAIFAKENAATVRIASAPIGVTVLVPQEIRVGQEVEIAVEYVSRADIVLENLQLEANYPFDFTYRSSSMQPVEGDNRWRISALQPGVTRTLLIRGVLAGSEFEEKAFRVSVGERGTDDLLRVYGSGVATTLLKKPFLEVAARINGAEQAVAFAGEQVVVDLPWRNNLPVGVKNVTIEARVEGAAASQNSIVPEDGAMRGDTIVWNAGTFPRFGFLDPGESGRVRVRFTLRSGMPEGEQNSNLTVTLRARIFAGETPEGFTGVDTGANASATLRIGSRLQLARRGFFYDGDTPNSGPIPARLGQETVFTVVWSLTNAFNEMRDVAVRTIVPPYMQWKSVVLPAGERITYTETTGELVWEVDRLEAGVGFSRPARTVSFQIGLVPTANQVGEAPVLLEKSQVSGRDTFVNTVSSDEASPLTLFQLDDPKVSVLERRVLP
ncbi:MAG: hypothetical protein HYU35_02875 [Parcubacteria group bacterium]|nr:hypothetical protein [Parcubacteria group bacterium]